MYFNLRLKDTAYLFIWSSKIAMISLEKRGFKFVTKEDIDPDSPLQYQDLVAVKILSTTYHNLLLGV